MRTATQYRWWLFSVVWAAVIFTLSGDSYSSAASAGALAKILRWLSMPGLFSSLGLVNLLLRKAAHLSEYGVFSMLLYHAIKLARDRSWSRRAANWAILLSAAYSLTDEFHQIFVAGRHPSFIDCVIDTAGAGMSLLLLFTLQTIRPREGYCQTSAPQFAPQK